MSRPIAPHHPALVVASTMTTTDGRLIQLHFFDLDRIPVSSLDSLAGEEKQAARFRSPRDAERLLVRRAVLRSLIGELKDLDPATVQLVGGGGVRPSIRGLAGFEFNTSHSDSCFAVATSTECLPGIDVEIHRLLPDLDSLVDRICSPEERRELKAFGPVSATWFLQLWTRKEAVLKGLGLGLKLDPARVTIPIQEAPLEGWVDAMVDGSGILPGMQLVTPPGIPDEIACTLAVQCPTSDASRSD